MLDAFVLVVIGDVQFICGVDIAPHSFSIQRLEYKNGVMTTAGFLDSMLLNKSQKLPLNSIPLSPVQTLLNTSKLDQFSALIH